jgi:hypothetical protein
MGDPANMRDPTKSSNEKESFEEPVLPVTPTWITSTGNLTRLLAKKLLAWGVEARGAYRIGVGTWSTLIRECFCAIPNPHLLL